MAKLSGAGSKTAKFETTEVDPPTFDAVIV